MQIDKRTVSSESLYFISAVAPESIFICLEERLAARLARHRQAVQGSGFDTLPERKTTQHACWE